jgi:hypothetical protein
MAKQTINIGTVANDGTGDTVRDAFDKVNDNFTELYSDDAGDVNSITATAPIARDSATGAVTISLNDAGVTLAKMQNVAANSVLVRDANSSGVLTEKALTDTQILIGDGTGMTAAALSGAITMTNGGVTSLASTSVDTANIVANAATAAKIALFDNSTAATNAHILIGDGTDFSNVAVSGDVTIANTGAVTIASQAVENSMIADNAVDHDELANRYTVTETVTNTTGATTINWGNASVFKMNASLTGGIEFDFTGFKTGQIISIYNLTGSQTVTLDSDAGTSETFNKVGGVDYAGGSTNLLQVECVDDSANAVFNYSVAAYVSDSTPS